MPKETHDVSLDTIDIYNLVNTKIHNDHVLHRQYYGTQNNNLMNFIEQTIVKHSPTKINKQIPEKK